MEDNGIVIENYFAQLFPEQQVKAANLSSMRWYPMMVRWCLYLRHLSGKGYDIVRKTLSLPSQRTLRDYTYYNNTQSGFSTATDKDLLDLISDRKDHEKLISDVIDERSRLCMTSTPRFCRHGDINNHLIR